MKTSFLPALLLVAQLAQSQTFTSYFSGDTSNVQTPVSGGLCLLGGGSEDDTAMRWFLARAGGGDIVVLRASGSDGYNDYLFSDLGTAVNSVETIVTTSEAAALDPYVARQVRHAEGLWLAGGDQSNYVKFWKNRPVGEAIRWLLNEKKAVVGGTSAGMAVLGGAYFDALNGGVTSAEALANPFDPAVSIGRGDFLDAPFMADVITDQHYEERDREGRHVVFLARLATEFGIRPRGIASSESVAVCVNELGFARIFGPTGSAAYFLQVNCEEPAAPETCLPGQKLTWNRGQAAVKSCRIPATPGGWNAFDLRDWKTHVGGGWQNWWAENGVLFQTPNAAAPDCILGVSKTPGDSGIQIFPNPTGDFLQVLVPENLTELTLQVIDFQGKAYFSTSVFAGRNEVPMGGLPAGIFWAKLEAPGFLALQKLVRSR